MLLPVLIMPCLLNHPVLIYFIVSGNFLVFPPQNIVFPIVMVNFMYELHSSVDVLEKVLFWMRLTLKLADFE